MCQESEKAGLKLSIQKNQDHGNLSHHCLQIEGDKVETVTDFIFLGSKITEDGLQPSNFKNSCFLEEKLWQT